MVRIRTEYDRRRATRAPTRSGRAVKGWGARRERARGALRSRRRRGGARRRDRAQSVISASRAASSVFSASNSSRSMAPDSSRRWREATREVSSSGVIGSSSVASGDSTSASVGSSVTPSEGVSRFCRRARLAAALAFFLRSRWSLANVVREAMMSPSSMRHGVPAVPSPYAVGVHEFARGVREASSRASPRRHIRRVRPTRRSRISSAGRRGLHDP